MSAIALLLAAAASASSAADWNPHSAADLLDTSFTSAASCQQRLDEARKRKSRAAPVQGLRYDELFERGRCEAKERHHALVYRIRLHWPQIEPRTAVAAARGSSAQADR